MTTHPSLSVVTSGIFIWLLLVCTPANADTDKVITAWTYYRFPPFLTEEHKGFSYDFIDLLNRYARGKYKFQLSFYPRKRLDALLASGKQGIVLFVHWSWMKDKIKNKYLWGPPIVLDRNEIISRIDKKIDFDGTPESLYGLTFGAVFGRHYKGLMGAMENKFILRENVATHDKNLTKILLGRVHVTTMPASMLEYFINNMELKGKLYKSLIPLSSYTRHIMATQGLQAEHEFLSQFVLSLSSNPEWKEIRTKYNLLPLTNP